MKRKGTMLFLALSIAMLLTGCQKIPGFGAFVKASAAPGQVALTMQEMKNVINLAKEEGVTAKVMIGGAVITQEYADEIGADGYSKDAADAVKLAQKLCES